MPTSCISGRWRLSAGHYHWGAVQPGGFNVVLWPNLPAGGSDPLYLGAGDYTMEACLDPHSPYGRGVYHQTVSLDPDNPAWQTINVGHYPNIADSGTHTWGAFLKPLF